MRAAEVIPIKPKEYERWVTLAIIITSVALGVVFLALYLHSTMVPIAGRITIKLECGNISYLAFAILLPIGPMSFYQYFKIRKIDKMEEKLPDFLRDLSEYWRGGLSMSAAITALSKTEYGALTKEVNKMATQISWGIAFQEVLKLLAERVKTKLVQRSVSLIDEANRAGGRISDILITASNDAREIKWLEVERRKGTATYVIVIYVGFFVYLAVVAVLSGVFLPAVVGAGGGLGEGGAGVGGITIAKIDTQLLSFILFCSVLVQAVGNGIVGGLMTEGKIVAGLKHSFIMGCIGWIVFAFIIYPLVGLAPWPSLW
ncbi:MAG: type II secretion system F family protein [Candidatus Thermoplasmatota archaeon]